jgi:hypothetical protein
MIGLSLGLAGCGSSSSNSAITPVSTDTSSASSATAVPLGNVTAQTTSARTLVVTEPSTIAVGEDQVDSLEAIGLDSAGNKVYDDRVDFANKMTFPNFPDEVATLELDYLRNHGFAIKRFTAGLPTTGASAKVDADAFQANSGGVELDNPHETPSSDQTRFSWKSDGNGGFQVYYTWKGKTLPIRFKAVDYGPSPIGYDVHANDALSDVFWDAYKTESGADQFNWYGLWGVGHLYSTYYAREDVNRIRSLGCNALRVYALIAKQLPSKYLNDNKKFPDFATYGHHFTHKAFLDQCWNNGVNPVFVLADIPLPDGAFLTRSKLDTGELTWWEANFTQSITDVKDHPAIMGFNVMNEKDANYAAAPPTGPDANTDYFYGQTMKYADLAKSIAPDKFVGWALHDFPDVPLFFSRNTSKDPQFASRGLYGEWLRSFDFWGLNVYQTINFDAELSPTIDIRKPDGSKAGLTYAQIPAGMQRPVFFTEVGWSGAARTADGAAFSTDPTEMKAADDRCGALITQMFSLAYGGDPNSKILCGTFFFSFSNEWWKSEQPTVFNVTPGVPYKSDLPSHYADEEGFGLYAVKRGGTFKNDDPYTDQYGNPLLPEDDLIPRPAMVKALTDIYKSH